MKVTGELGKQLDSLADMVTSGVVPGIVMMQLFIKADNKAIDEGLITVTKCFAAGGATTLSYIGFLITLASAYRLAKFNIDTRQTDSFIGVPTPANTLLVLSLPLILEFQHTAFLESFILNKWFLIGFTLLIASAFVLCKVITLLF